MCIDILIGLFAIFKICIENNYPVWQKKTKLSELWKFLVGGMKRRSRFAWPNSEMRFSASSEFPDNINPTRARNDILQLPSTAFLYIHINTHTSGRYSTQKDSTE